MATSKRKVVMDRQPRAEACTGETIAAVREVMDSALQPRIARAAGLTLGDPGVLSLVVAFRTRNRDLDAPEHPRQEDKQRASGVDAGEQTIGYDRHRRRYPPPVEPRRPSPQGKRNQCQCGLDNVCLKR